jgi:hypothetical protein
MAKRTRHRHLAKLAARRQDRDAGSQGDGQLRMTGDGRKGDVAEGESEVDLVVLPPDVTAEQVTVPPEEPTEQAPIQE